MLQLLKYLSQLGIDEDTALYEKRGTWLLYTLSIACIIVTLIGQSYALIVIGFFLP